MSKQASKKAIGVFVLGALTLAVFAIIIFGGGKIFQRSLRAVVYFDGSVGGLNIGAPVVFRGVKVGSVTDIQLRYNQTNQTVQIPVYISLLPDKVVKEHKRADWEGATKEMRMLIDRGLRAQLQLQSIVTGQLMVNLDFVPDKAARFVGDTRDKNIFEIPSVPTALQELTKSVERIPLDEIVDKIRSSLEGIEKIINSPDTPRIVNSLAQGIDESRTLVKEVTAQVRPIAQRLDEALKEIQILAKDTDAAIKPVSVKIEKIASDAQSTLSVANKTLANLEAMTGDDSEILYRTARVLRDLDAAARSVRTMADTLERQPESVVFGRKPLKEADR